MTQLTVSIEDVSMLDQIKQAISMLRGVKSVTLKRRRKTSMDRAIEDIEQGRVYKYDSLDDLIKEIEGDPNQIVDHRADVAEEYNESFVETGELESLW